MPLIDRDAVMAGIDRLWDANPAETPYTDFGQALDSVSDIIEMAPTIDPVKHGRWVWYETWSESTTDGPTECQEAGYRCSECGIDLSEYLSEALGETIYADNALQAPKIKSCPSCGAKMGGDTNA